MSIRRQLLIDFTPNFNHRRVTNRRQKQESPVNKPHTTILSFSLLTASLFGVGLKVLRNDSLPFVTGTRVQE